MIKPFKKPLEAILRKLAKDNNIRTFHFVTYSADIDSNKLGPEEVEPYQLIPVRASYLKTHPLSDLARQYCATDDVFGIASTVWVPEGEGVVRKEIVQLDIDAQWPDTRRPQMTDADVPFDVARRASESCGQSSYLVHSSTSFGFCQSFHFYGKKLVTHDEWRVLMRNVESNSLVDHRWSEYNLARGYSVLRVSANKIKPQAPVPVLQMV